MKLIIGAVAVVLLAGCGSSAGASAASVADTLGCSPTTVASEELYVKQLETCQMSGGEVSIYTFASKGDADSWWDVAKGFGEGTLVRASDVVIVSGNDTVSAAAARSALGQ